MKSVATIFKLPKRDIKVKILNEVSESSVKTDQSCDWNESYHGRTGEEQRVDTRDNESSDTNQWYFFSAKKIK